MIRSRMRLLEELEGTDLHAGIDPWLIEQIERDHGLILPIEHKELLRWTNGAEVYWGHFRFFGLSSSEAVDSVLWNANDHWKFAWSDRCSPYWCFAETAFGDQYAYSSESLRDRGDSYVYLLHAFSMKAELVADSFSEFLDNEFVRSATEPYDKIISQARQVHGRLDLNDHLVYVPSLLLGGTEDINNVQRMNARAAMICNGDLAIQLDAGAGAQGPARVANIETYQDALGRPRLRVVWEEVTD